MAGMRVVAAGSLICYDGGTLMLAVISYDEEHDCLRMEPISWRLAQTLVPDQLESIRDQLRELRSPAQKAA